MTMTTDALAGASRVGYVTKIYPRFSETFIVNEILALERTGLELEIFSLRHVLGGRFHQDLGRVRAPVTYVERSGLKAADLWARIAEASDELPDLFERLAAFHEEDAHDVYQGLAVALAARRRGIEHLHAHFATSGTTVARIAARLAGLRYSFTAHAKDIFHRDVDLDDLRAKLDEASAVVTVSEHNVAYLGSLCPQASVRRVYNGLELERFPYSDPRERPARILGVGRLVEKKGFEHLIDACALLAQRGRRFECEIVGTGELEAQLRGQVAALGLAEHVRLSGARTQDEVRALMTASAVLAAPCVVGADGNRDGLPTVLLEAMALGTPCVSTDVTGIPEVLRHEETGLAVPQRSSEELAAALCRLLDDAALRVDLAERGRALIEERFDVDRNATALRSLFAAPAPAAVEAVA